MNQDKNFSGGERSSEPGRVKSEGGIRLCEEAKKWGDVGKEKGISRGMVDFPGAKEVEYAGLQQREHPGVRMTGQRRGLTVRRLLIWVPILMLLSACAKPLTDVASDFKSLRPTRIAILPVKNETADMDAPTVFRILARAELADRGFGLIDFVQIDAALREKGIEEAGQIESLTPQEIGECLGADGLLYITVLGYGRQMGVHLKAEGSFTLVEPKTGQKLWFSELSVSDDILLEGGAAVLMGELFGGRDKKKSKEQALEIYMAVRKARIAAAVNRFRSHPIKREVFQTITLDMDKIFLLEIFFSRNFNKLPRP
jgi:hypothetical protein